MPTITRTVVAATAKTPQVGLCPADIEELGVKPNSPVLLSTPKGERIRAVVCVAEGGLALSEADLGFLQCEIGSEVIVSA